MKRRTYLGAMLAGASTAAAQTAKAAQNIQLFVDFEVDAAKEKEMLHHFHTVFHPAGAKFAGFIDLKLLKLRTALQGAAPPAGKYRFELTYESEELRQKWITSAVHGKVWGALESMFKSKNYTVYLYDITRG